MRRCNLRRRRGARPPAGLRHTRISVRRLLRLYLAICAVREDAR